MNPEQRHGRNADRVQTHDAPRTLHHRQPLLQARIDAVEAVQDLAFRQARGELPLPLLPDLLWIESAAGIADRTALGIMESDCDAPLEETRALVGPGLEAQGRLEIDPLVREQGGVRMESQLSSIGLTGPIRRSHLGPGGRWPALDQRDPISSDFRVWAVVHARYPLNHVAATAATGKEQYQRSFERSTTKACG